jgi:hypothetical protein
MNDIKRKHQQLFILIKVSLVGTPITPSDDTLGLVACCQG